MGSQVILNILRVLVVVIALGVVGVGVWTKFIVNDIEVRGLATLNRANFDSQDDNSLWGSFLRTAINNQLRIWIAIAAGAFSTLATILVIFSLNIQRMRLPTPFLLPLELLSSLSLATAFGSTLSLALKFPPTIPDSRSSADLASFAILLPLSRAYAIGAGTGMFLSLTTTISFLIQTIHRVRDSKACSFEPTASALGMGHGYQVPTTDGTQSGDEEKGLAEAGAEMGRRESVYNGNGKANEAVVSWPLAVAKKMEAANMTSHRPHRPWSEMPKR